MVPDMFCKFYSVKNHKNAKNSATIEAEEKVSIGLEYLVFYLKNSLTKFSKKSNFTFKHYLPFLVTVNLFIE
jgi:hypothetical protein